MFWIGWGRCGVVIVRDWSLGALVLGSGLKPTIESEGKHKSEDENYSKHEI